MDITFLWQTWVTLLGGVPLTINLAFVSVLLGGCLAVVLAVAALSPLKPLQWAVGGYVFVFRGTPLLIQIFLIYYGLGQFRPSLQAIGLWPILREPYWCAIFALALNTAAYTSEIIRGGILSVPEGAIEAATSCGMTKSLIFRRIILPIALRQALPAYGNELILMVKATSLASIITMMEVTGLAGKLISESYRTVEVFVCAGSIYLAMNFILTRGIRLIEWWLSPDRPRASQKSFTSHLSGASV